MPSLEAARREVAELRRLVKQASAATASVERAESSIHWAERVSGLELDPWQRDVMLSDDPRLALLCARQIGKSTIVALKAADVVRQGGLAVAVSPSMRQSGLLYQKIRRALFAGDATFARSTAVELELANGGLVVSLPGDRPDMLRGLSLRWPKTSLLLIDEASRVRESMWPVVSPMLASAPQARQILLSTPAGAGNEFHRVFASDDNGWRRVTVTAESCARISADFLEREKVRLGEALFRQEYECAFVSSPGSVFSADVLSAMFEPIREGDDGEGAREDPDYQRGVAPMEMARAASSSNERLRLDAFRQALGAPERILTRPDNENGEAAASERYFFLEGLSGHVVISTSGGYWILAHSRSPMTIEWAAKAIGAFAQIRRLGAHSVLAEMSRLPNAEEAAMLRQALGIPLVLTRFAPPTRFAEPERKRA